LNIVVWNEYVHERRGGVPAELYPDGIHTAIADCLRAMLGADAQVRTATLDEPDHGLADAVLDDADVVVWWGHLAHDQVSDELARRVQQRVLDGMGLVVLHSGHYSKPFRLLMGTGCGLRWREADDRELVWTVSPGHPIAAGIPAVIPIEKHEMYGEFFDIPAPDELVFISSFSGGEVFRSGCCFARGKGKVFYFSPGHETYPIYHDPVIQRVIANAVEWAKADLSSGVVVGVEESERGWFER
jgi:trehalose utilization protein